MTRLSNLTPKAQLSAFERWEVASLADEDIPAMFDPGREQSAKAQLQKEAADLREIATVQGFAAGHAAGLAQAVAEKAQLENLIKTLSACAGDHEQHLADEVLDLALVVARQLVGEALSIRREFVLPVVSAALHQLPQSVQRVQLLLNPGDMELVKGLLALDPLGQRCHLIPDPMISPGGCRIETEQCELDATVPSRWRQLLAALGRSEDWLEPA